MSHSEGVFVVGIENIMKCVEFFKLQRNGSQCLCDKKMSESMLPIIQAELNCISTIFSSETIELSTNLIIRARIQFVLFVCHSFFKFCEDSHQYPLLCQLSVESIQGLFDLSKFIDDHSDIHKKASLQYEIKTNIMPSLPATTLSYDVKDEDLLLPPDRSSWFQICITSLALLLVKLLKLNAHCKNNINVALSECVSSCGSSIWQQQYISLGLLQAIISMEIKDSTYENMELRDSVKIQSHNNAILMVHSEDDNSSKIKTISHSLSSDHTSFDNNYHSKNDKNNNKADQSGKKRSNKQLIQSDQPVITPKSSKHNDNQNNNNNSQSKITKSEKFSAINNSTSKSIKLSSLSDSIDENQSNSRKDSKISNKFNLKNKNLSKRGNLLVFSSIDELCKCGFMRTLTWLLLHSVELVRKLAGEIILSIITHTIRMDSIYDDINSDLWASTVEQGLIPLLESITTGMIIHDLDVNNSIISSNSFSNNNNNDNNLFPEYNIRKVAATYLTHTSYSIENRPAIAQRLMSSLIVSGNFKLRNNIFVGIIFLCSRRPSLGRLLKAFNQTSKNLISLKSQNNNYLSNMEHQEDGLSEMFRNVLKDQIELSQIIQILKHFIQKCLLLSTIAQNLNNNNHFNSNKTNELGTQTKESSFLNNNNNNISFSTFLSNNTNYLGIIRQLFNPIVMIIENNIFVKMTCPNLIIIGHHSNELMKLLETALIHQIEAINTSSSNMILKSNSQDRSYSDSNVRGHENENIYNNEIILQLLSDIQSQSSNNSNSSREKLKKLNDIITQTLDDSYFIKLAGSYSVWQEIFSQMTDSYLMESSIKRMDSTCLIQAFQISYRFNMTYLREQYAINLSYRINNQNFIQLKLSDQN
eukprot:gene8347-11292_t